MSDRTAFVFHFKNASQGKNCVFFELVKWVAGTRAVEASWNAMAHAQKPDFVFRRNGRVHLNRRGHQLSRLLAAEVCASAVVMVVMLDTPCSEVVWRILATHSIRQFPLHFPTRASPCAITFQLDSTLQIATVSRKMSPENWEKRACVPRTTALVLLGVFVSRCGWATPSSIQVAVLMHAALVKLEGCPPAVDFLPCWRFLYEKVYNLNRSAPFLKYAPRLCYTGLCTVGTHFCYSPQFSSGSFLFGQVSVNTCGFVCWNSPLVFDRNLYSRLDVCCIASLVNWLVP